MEGGVTLHSSAFPSPNKPLTLILLCAACLVSNRAHQKVTTSSWDPTHLLHPQQTGPLPPATNPLSPLLIGLGLLSNTNIESLVRLPTSDHSPECEAPFPEHGSFLDFWLFSKSWYQVTVSLRLRALGPCSCVMTN